MFLDQNFDSRVETCVLDQARLFLKRVHHHLDVKLVQFVEKALDGVFVDALIVQKHEFDVSGSAKSRDSQIVELVNFFEKHRVPGPDALIDHIECGMNDKLIQILFLPNI
jgi:hypothetical protein